MNLETPDERRERLFLAWSRTTQGNAEREDGLLVLAHLAVLSGYYTIQDFASWRGSAEGYQLHCVAAAEKRAIFSQIRSYLDVDRIDRRQFEDLVTRLTAPPK